MPRRPRRSRCAAVLTAAPAAQRRPCRRPRGTSASCRRAASSGSAPRHVSSMRLPALGRRRAATVPDANRSPGRSVAPFTVRWASCWAKVQYRCGEVRRARSSWPLSSTREVEVEAPRPRGAQVRVGLAGPAPAARRGTGRSASSVTTHGEIDVAKLLPRKRAERLVLERLDVARRPVVEQHDAEDVAVGVVGRDASPPGRAADDEADLELDVERRGRREARHAVAGSGTRPVGPAHRRAGHDDRAATGRGSRPAGGASSAAAARRRAAACGRGSWRGGSTSRSRRSRRPRRAAAPATSSSECSSVGSFDAVEQLGRRGRAPRRRGRAPSTRSATGGPVRSGSMPAAARSTHVVADAHDDARLAVAQPEHAERQVLDRELRPLGNGRPRHQPDPAMLRAGRRAPRSGRRGSA